MSKFSNKLKARLKSSHQLSPNLQVDTGWVRAALQCIEKGDELQDSTNYTEKELQGSTCWEKDLIDQMKDTSLACQDETLKVLNCGHEHSNFDLSPKCASQKFWETGSLECKIPDGFYSVIPSTVLKGRFKTIPTFGQLKELAVDTELDILLVDSREDKNLAKLKEFIVALVGGSKTNSVQVVKDIAEVVADFYGGPLLEAGTYKGSADEDVQVNDNFDVQLLGQVTRGLCRPRAILFKYLADAVGLKTRIFLGLQLEEVPSTFLICSNPNKHLSTVVDVNGVEFLVDVMRYPGHLRPFSVKSLVSYHTSGPGDSDSADYDSCDSPLEPNSPLYGSMERIDCESPSHSEPDLTSAWWQQRRKKALSADHGSPEPPYNGGYVQRRYIVDGVRSSPSSPEHSQTSFRSFRPLGSEEGNISSSPEYPVFRARAPSKLSGSRQHIGEDVDGTCFSSPENSPQHQRLLGKNSTLFFRRRTTPSFKSGDSGRIPHSLSCDVRRVRKRSTLEISDNVVRVVRAMNEVMKQSQSEARWTEDERKKISHEVLYQERHGESKQASGHMEERHSSAHANKDSPANDWCLSANDGTTNSSGYPENTSFEASSERTSECDFRQMELPAKVAALNYPDNSPAQKAMLSSLDVLQRHTLMPYAEWNIDFSELRIGIRVGIGSFGEVFRGIWRGTEVAIKLMLEQDLTKENTEDFCNEIRLLSRLRHPNVILFLGACTKPPHLSLVTEYMHMGSLYHLVHLSGQGKKLSWRRRFKMLRDICRGMMCVHRMNIIHRDLKSANCLVDKHWSVKICDFGLSRITTGVPIQESTVAGTPEWMAPELLRNEPVTDKCDIFSLGVIMWELCTLKRPWEGFQPMQVVSAVVHDNARLQVPDGLLGKLVTDCWAEVPAARPSYDEILTRLHECEFLQN
ncbi:hypothetical protein O6H91_04G099000 [Diphasiastrum complanatum]|uniref:Uncharacterized protein n=1 Tax=Diphasiastrum complanatum TaxID=34168 RepID=A0ACC2E0F6_DIPCM|nr:hypothetical protein O6H91_04G099000 [Diphasiastrum complanatum]